MLNQNPVLTKVFPSILIFLGCFLLLLGNTLSWPCYPGSWHGGCDPSLNVLFVSDFGVGIFIALVTLMLLLEVSLFEGSMSYIAWASYWIILYFLFVAKIRTDSTFPSLHYTWVFIKWNLVTIVVTPLSLVSYWLALRPKDLRQKYRKLARFCLFALLLSTSFFLAFAMLALNLQLRFAFEVGAAIETAPVVILAGGLLLLGAEYAEMQFDKQKFAQDDEEEQEDIEQVENDIN